MSQLAATLKPVLVAHSASARTLVLVAHSTPGATSEPGAALEARAASDKQGEDDVMPFWTEEPAEIHSSPA